MYVNIIKPLYEKFNTNFTIYALPALNKIKAFTLNFAQCSGFVITAREIQAKLLIFLLTAGNAAFRRGNNIEIVLFTVTEQNFSSVMEERGRSEGNEENEIERLTAIGI